MEALFAFNCTTLYVFQQTCVSYVSALALADTKKNILIGNSRWKEPKEVNIKYIQKMHGPGKEMFITISYKQL